VARYSPIIQITGRNICNTNGKLFLEGIMRSGLQREEIEFIMGLFSYNETTDKPAAPKKQPVKADTKKVDTAQYKANYKATYLT